MVSVLGVMQESQGGLSFAVPGRVIDLGTTGPRPSRSHDEYPPVTPARTRDGRPLVGGPRGAAARALRDGLPDPDRGDRRRPEAIDARGLRLLGPQPPGRGEAAARIGALRDAVERLRSETHTGWVGRQDDVTGFLAELSGGSWPGDPAAFIDEHGRALFGVDSATLRLEVPDTDTVPNVTTTRATQALGAVPVLDASLVLTGRGSPAATDEQRVTGVLGRVFPDLTVDTTPTITAEQATTIAAEASGGTTDGSARLVVLPSGSGALAWEVVVVGATPEDMQAGRYYIDAHTGDLVDVRPVSAELLPPVPHLGLSAAPDPNSVTVTGTDPLGRDLTAFGLQNGDRVELTDTTTDAWDAEQRTGAIQTFDASTLKNESALPGTLVSGPSTQISDPEAIAAQAYSHRIVDYYESLGRDSWDDRGGPLISSVHFGPENYCNAMFA